MEIGPGRFYTISCQGSDGKFSIVAKALSKQGTRNGVSLWKCEGREKPYDFTSFVASENQFGKETLPPISKTALKAIQNGIERNDPVANLEYLGLDHRNINALEFCDKEIVFLRDLVLYQKDELSQIPNFGAKSIVQLFDALSRYHLLGKMMEVHKEDLTEERKKWFPQHFDDK